MPPLSDDKYQELLTLIKRDGVISPVCYWHNPETGKDEIIDGHHRHKAAQEMGVLYDVKEIDFTGKTITAVKYWMHVNQSARRGGERNIARMVELRQKMTDESKTQAVKAVAKDADVSESSVWRDVRETKPSPATPFDRIIKLIAKLSDDDRRKIKELL